MESHKCQQVSETTTTVLPFICVCKSKAFLLRTLCKAFLFFSCAVLIEECDSFQLKNILWHYTCPSKSFTVISISTRITSFFWIAIQRKGRAISSPNITGTTDVTWCITSELEGGSSMQLPTHGLFVHVLPKWLKWSWFWYVPICPSYYFNIGVTTENETSNTV